ncbi:MAG: energy-coupled thiamine transporter ThiT [Firmicutes bacterium]|nr:energy-coupled thiamine transporter ThiT [Bacillota bacterium]
MFWDTTAGHVITGFAALAALALTGAGLIARSRRRAEAGVRTGIAGKKPFSVRTLTYCAICIAMALILSRIKLFQMPQGGDVTLCSMLFIVLAGYWFGPEAGILAGVSEGLLRFAISSTPAVHPVQILLDYPLAFGALGVAGFFRHIRYGLITGYVAGCLCLFCMSFMSGVVFFASYANGQNVFLYSAVYNLSYILPEMAITCALLAVPQFRRAIEGIKNAGAA